MSCTHVFTAPQAVRSPLTRIKLHETYGYVLINKHFRDHGQLITLATAENYTKYDIYHMLWRYLHSSCGTKKFKKIGKKLALERERWKQEKFASKYYDIDTEKGPTKIKMHTKFN